MKRVFKSAGESVKSMKADPGKIHGLFPCFFQDGSQCWECFSGSVLSWEEKEVEIQDDAGIRERGKGEQMVRWRASLKQVLHIEDMNSIACCYLL